MIVIPKDQLDIINMKGVCDTCHNNKTLDVMVRKNYVKGKYHCIDCETTKFNEDYDPFMNGKLNLTPTKQTMIKKLIGWCFG